MSIVSPSVAARGRASLGTSDESLYARAREILLARGARGHVADVGCGRGLLRPWLDGLATAYCGVDAVRFDEFPSDVPLLIADLDRDPLPLPDRSTNVTIALETIEHLENPRRFVRELARITTPGGTILISTPNQLSALSLATLAWRGEFNAFQPADYPAHITALLPVDLLRIGGECGLADMELIWSLCGRLPLTGTSFPRWVSRTFPTRGSDHVFLAARIGTE